MVWYGLKFGMKYPWEIGILDFRRINFLLVDTGLKKSGVNCFFLEGFNEVGDIRQLLKDNLMTRKLKKRFGETQDKFLRSKLDKLPEVFGHDLSERLPTGWYTQVVVFHRPFRKYARKNQKMIISLGVNIQHILKTTTYGQQN